MAFGVSKINGKLLYRNLGGYETRNPSTFWCIQESDKKYNWNDFNEIIIYTDDYERNVNEYTYTKRNSYHKVVPDFNFHNWPQVGIDDYEDTIRQIDHAGIQPYELNKVGWIGNTNTHYKRKKC